MSTSSRFAIAIHTLAVLGYLKKHGVERATSQQIAKSVNTNAVVIRNLLRALKRAGLVEAKEGKDGGISLARPPAKISLRDVYAAVEEGGILCLNKNPELKACPVSREMSGILHPIFSEVDKAVAKTLQCRNLKSLVDLIST
ncbi:MAG: Rrf2 family transcriptional regulator [Deltaproteobacteria bacterium]|nr:Rrf2 family transcriptional regulator [Deltaproteobacteria bacterium]